MEHSPQQWESVRRAIRTFDDRLHWLKRLRDVFEHLEDYAVDSNRRRSSTSRCELQVWSAGKNGMTWLGFEVNWKEAYEAAQALYAAVKAAYDSLTPKEGQSPSSITASLLSSWIDRIDSSSGMHQLTLFQGLSDPCLP